MRGALLIAGERNNRYWGIEASGLHKGEGSGCLRKLLRRLRNGIWGRRAHLRGRERAERRSAAGERGKKRREAHDGFLSEMM